MLSQKKRRINVVMHKQKLEDIKLIGKSLDITTSINTIDLKELFQKMQEHQLIFDKTGGSHAAAIFDTEKNLLVLREDIGRHNAVDKAIGSLLNQNKLKQVGILLVSGRVSYEIISKAFIAKIPVIAAVSACFFDYIKHRVILPECSL